MGGGGLAAKSLFDGIDNLSETFIAVTHTVTEVDWNLGETLIQATLSKGGGVGAIEKGSSGTLVRKYVGEVSSWVRILQSGINKIDLRKIAHHLSLEIPRRSCVSIDARDDLISRFCARSCLSQPDLWSYTMHSGS